MYTCLHRYAHSCGTTLTSYLGADVRKPSDVLADDRAMTGESCHGNAQVKGWSCNPSGTKQSAGHDCSSLASLGDHDKAKKKENEALFGTQDDPSVSAEALSRCYKGARGFGAWESMGKMMSTGVAGGGRTFLTRRRSKGGGSRGREKETSLTCLKGVLQQESGRETAEGADRRPVEGERRKGWWEGGKEMQRSFVPRVYIGRGGRSRSGD